MATKVATKVETYIAPLIVEISDETNVRPKFETKLDPVLKVKARNKSEYKDASPPMALPNNTCY